MKAVIGMVALLVLVACSARANPADPADGGAVPPPASQAAAASPAACPYVADGGTALALVTVTDSQGSCSAVDPSGLGAVGSYSSFTIDKPSDNPENYAAVAGDDASQPEDCRVTFPHGIIVTVYATGLDAVQPMVCAALRGVPSEDFN